MKSWKGLTLGSGNIYRSRLRPLEKLVFIIMDQDGKCLIPKGSQRAFSANRSGHAVQADRFSRFFQRPHSSYGRAAFSVGGEFRGPQNWRAWGVSPLVTPIDESVSYIDVTPGG